MARKIPAFVIVVVVFIAGLAFAAENAHQVELNYFVGSAEWALSLVLVVAVLVGVLLGALVSVIPVLKMKSQIRSLRRSEAVAREEIRNLRTLPIKDAP